jgi:hypothetical protein
MRTMRSLTDYKNRVRAERAVTDWLTGDSVNWRSLSRGNASREDAPPAATPHFGTALSLNGSWAVPRHLIHDLYFNLPGPSALGQVTIPVVTACKPSSARLMQLNRTFRLWAGRLGHITDDKPTHRY